MSQRLPVMILMSKAGKTYSILQFIPVIPDFVIELCSSTDSLSYIRSKMNDYQRVGVRLSLLINPQVDIYRQGREPEILNSPIAIDCDEVMAGLVLSMSEIW